jgi:hypothetical protein
VWYNLGRRKRIMSKRNIAIFLVLYFLAVGLGYLGDKFIGDIVAIAFPIICAGLYGLWLILRDHFFPDVK